MGPQRIGLEHHADKALIGRQHIVPVGHHLLADTDLTGGGGVKPASSRNSVVLPQPDGPRTAINSPS